MIYKSNLPQPDMVPFPFRHVWSRVMGHSFGHDVPSDWGDKRDDDPVFGLYRNCGSWTHDEAAILAAIGGETEGRWLDIGAHTGWTAAHLATSGCRVTAVEPMLQLPEWWARFALNTDPWRPWILPFPGRSEQFFQVMTEGGPFDGVVIDGDHDPPWPFIDACCAHSRLADDGVIVFHDVIGQPTWRGIETLLDLGYRCHVYHTPHMVTCCWRGEWQPPMHQPDPAIDWREIHSNHMKGFPWHRVSHEAIGS